MEMLLLGSVFRKTGIWFMDNMAQQSAGKGEWVV